FEAARGLDGVALELLEPGDRGERQRETAVRADAEDEQGLEVRVARRAAVESLDRSTLGGLGDDVGPLRETEHVEDERDPPVAHDRRAREDRDVLELLVER